MSQPAVAEHIIALHRYARALLGNRSEAEDLVQECLARALSRAHLWRPGSDLRAWLFTILHNIYINNLRNRHALAVAERLPLSRAERGMTTPPFQDIWLELRDLDQALRRISDDQRQVLLLVGMEGLSYEEAARIVDVPVGTVMSRVARGREALRRYMAR